MQDQVARKERAAAIGGQPRVSTMREPIDPLVQRALESIAPPGVLVGHRLISPGDGLALLKVEAATISSSLPEVWRASGAARVVARDLMAQLGHPPLPILKGEGGMPIWPIGVVGSLAHDDRVAVAAVTNQRDASAFGIDVEPAEPLPPDVLEVIATPRELSQIAGHPLGGRLLFAAKEAVYKAVYPQDRAFLEFRDIEIDFADRTAMTSTGRLVTIRYCVSSHVLVLGLA